MVLPILALGLVSFLICLAATAIIKRIAPRVGFVDRPGQRKIHHVPKPLGGGVAIFLGIALPLLGALGLLHLAYDRITDPGPGGSLIQQAWHALAMYKSGIRDQTPLALWVLLTLLFIHLMGLFDDARPLGPYLKLTLQLLAIAALVLQFNSLRALTMLDSWGLGKAPSILLTILWITAITNAFNFLDNMDGLSAGTAAVAASAFLITTLTMPQPQWFVAAMLALLIGALVGFLCYNFAPASIFMGDSGSTVIGLLLGILTIRTTYLPPDRQLAAGWYSVLAPLIVLAVPLYDLVVVSLIRIRRGKSPFVGDTNHLSHRLVARGMSRRTAVLCVWLMTAATSIAAILLPRITSTFGAMLIFAQTLLVLGLVALLEQHPLPQAPANEAAEPSAAASPTDSPAP